MKKIRNFLLLNIIAIFIMGMTVSAAGGLQLTLTPDKTSLKPGDTVTVTLGVSSNPGIITLGTEISYDPDVFTLVSKNPTAGTWLSNNGSSNVANDLDKYGNRVVFAHGDDLAEENNTGTGTIASFVLEVKSDAVKGDTQISVSSVDAVEFDINKDVTVNSLPTTTINIICEHTNKQAVSAKDPTCDTAGNIAYYKCPDCNKYFNDAACTSEITDKDSVVIAALGHNMTKTAAKAATCDTAGNIEYYTCSRCNNIYKDKNGTTKLNGIADTVVNATGHSLTTVAAKEATCEEDGNKLYYKCSKCNKLFSDAAGTTETTLEAVTLTKTGHTLTKVNAKDTDCEHAGNKEHYKCSSCGKLFSDADGKNATTSANVTIAALGHNMTKTAAKAATCEETGNIEYYTCSRCNNIYKDADGKTKLNSIDDTIVAATGHKLTKVAAKAATCETDGNKEYYKCSICGKLFADAKGSTETTLAAVTILKTGHKLTKVEAAAATCEKDGNKEHYKCSNCDKLFLDADGKSVTTSDAVTIKALGHSWDEGEITKKASATEDGIITYTCKTDKTHTKTESFKEKTQTPVAKAVTSYSDSTITTKLSTELGKKQDFETQNIAYYDIDMMVSVDNGKTYVPVTKETMPKEGIKVRIPYPAGTNAVDYDFVVLHLLSDGTIETLIPEETSENLIVIAKSFSPFAVGYKEGEEDEPDDGDEEDGITSSTSTETPNDGVIRSPKTGDALNATMWILLAGVGIMAAGGAAYGYRNKRK